MDFDKVTALLDEGKIDDVKTALNEFKPQFEKTVGDLKAYEGKFNEAVQTRDKAKGKLKEISGVFGIDSDELTTDKLKELIKTAKADDASKAEIENLTKLIAQKENEFSEKIANQEARFKEKIIETEIAKSGLLSVIGDDKETIEIAMGLVKKGSILDEKGAVSFLGEDGLIQRNGTGQPLTISDRVNEFLNSGIGRRLRNATSNGGGGSQSSNGGSGSKNRSSMTHAEKGKFIQEHGEEAYLNLPK